MTPAQLGILNDEPAGDLWQRLDVRDAKGHRRKCALHMRHVSGIEIRHCGHMTANWPYYLIDPAWPDDIIVSHNGLGFTALGPLMRMVEQLAAGTLSSTAKDCVPGIRRIPNRCADGSEKRAP